jgi:hypothetical protein
MRFTIDTAPGKDLIPLIIENLSYQDFKSFYDIRRAWEEGPLIQDSVFTYGMYDDFINQLPSEMETLAVLFDYSITIAEQETNKKFNKILFLISNICFTIRHINGFTEDNLLKLKKIKPQVVKLTHLSYVNDCWENIVNSIASHASFVKEDFDL